MHDQQPHGKHYWARHKRHPELVVVYVAGQTVSATRLHGPYTLEDFELLGVIPHPAGSGGACAGEEGE